MPIEKVGNKFRWGKHGKAYSSRKDAERQAAAAYANGYEGKAISPKKVNNVARPPQPMHAVVKSAAIIVNSIRESQIDNGIMEALDVSNALLEEYRA